ncbi:MAG: thiamine pyrophosphate-dependent enzyme [Halobacteriota archaeon]
MKEYLLGNAAIARGILEAGAGVVTSYPGTPASEIVESLAPVSKEYNLHIEWSVNEKVALEVAIGASWTGVRSAAVMKHVGLNVAADPFMTLAVDMGTIDTCLCMGASINLASGIRFGGEDRDICCSIGDSTFLHNGMPGLLNAVYNNAKITVTILDNLTTAMTGHQPHPGTGVTATGDKTKSVSIEALANVLGADFVETVDPYDLNATLETFRKAKECQGLSVVIAKQACITNAIRAGVRRKPFRVNDNCVGCRECVDFGCPAIEFHEDRARINSLCTGCSVCAQICPSEAIEEGVNVK